MSDVVEMAEMDHGPRGREDAFRELEIFLRAGVKVVGTTEITIKRLSEGFEFDEQDIECHWHETAHGGQPGWQIVAYYTELDLLTDEVRYVGPEVLRTFGAGEEHDVAKHAILCMVGNWIEGAMANT